MLEQEIASIIKFVLDEAGNPSPYYYKVPQSFVSPAAYFPTPEIDTGGETFLTYSVDYTWFIKIFHKTSAEAYSLGLDVITAIKGNRNLVPLITETGERGEGSIRLNDPKLKVLDNGAAQLTLSWRSRRPYNSEQVEKMQRYNVERFDKAALYKEPNVTDAMAEALEKYAVTE